MCASGEPAYNVSTWDLGEIVLTRRNATGKEGRHLLKPWLPILAVVSGGRVNRPL